MMSNIKIEIKKKQKTKLLCFSFTWKQLEILPSFFLFLKCKLILAFLIRMFVSHKCEIRTEITASTYDLKKAIATTTEYEKRLMSIDDSYYLCFYGANSTLKKRTFHYIISSSYLWPKRWEVLSLIYFNKTKKENRKKIKSRLKFILNYVISKAAKQIFFCHYC